MIDYNIDQAPNGSFKVVGDTPTEVMDKVNIHYTNPEIFLLSTKVVGL